ncbi:hypothetical protein M426DRAFT_23192 [Hypoxylon sp. CI-4A]|nr:hypothetical protein M426DRAFT_23192 [Hypoxylon sp. CI-4A]
MSSSTSDRGSQTSADLLEDLLNVNIEGQYFIDDIRGELNDLFSTTTTHKKQTEASLKAVVEGLASLTDAQTRVPETGKENVQVLEKMEEICEMMRRTDGMGQLDSDEVIQRNRRIERYLATTMMIILMLVNFMIIQR